MKKTIILSAVFAFVFIAVCATPTETNALKASNFKHVYTGSWALKYDSTHSDNVIDDRGDLTIDISELNSSGKITYATVTFSTNSYFSTGYIYKRHGKNHIVLNYSYTDSDGYFLTYDITGHITKNKIKGDYTHYYVGNDSYWGGTINVKR